MVVTDFLFLDSKITADSDYRPGNQRTIASWQESDDKPRQCVEKQRHYSVVMLKLQYFGHLMPLVDSLEKTLMLGKIEGRRRGGQQRMSWLDGITDSIDMNLSKLGNSEGQGSLVCCSSWGRKELDRI